MFWQSNYSRTTRAAELYEQYLYSRVKGGLEGKDRWLNGLIIAPFTKRDGAEPEKDTMFAPKYQNWRRNAKVPILFLNAATLNTGHTWQQKRILNFNSAHSVCEVVGNAVPHSGSTS